MTYLIYEPRLGKTGIQCFRPGPRQTGLYNPRRKLEILALGSRRIVLSINEKKGADQLLSSQMQKAGFLMTWLIYKPGKGCYNVFEKNCTLLGPKILKLFTSSTQ